MDLVLPIIPMDFHGIGLLQNIEFLGNAVEAIRNFAMSLYLYY